MGILATLVNSLSDELTMPTTKVSTSPTNGGASSLPPAGSPNGLTEDFLHGISNLQLISTLIAHILPMITWNYLRIIDRPSQPTSFLTKFNLDFVLMNILAQSNLDFVLVSSLILTTCENLTSILVISEQFQ